MRRRDIVLDSDDGDDDVGSIDRFPSLDAVATPRPAAAPRRRMPARTPKPPKDRAEADTAAAGPSTAVRRRKLGNLGNDASLLRAAAANGVRREVRGVRRPEVEIDLPDTSPEPRRPRTRPRIELRTRRARRVLQPADDDDSDHTQDMSEEEASVLEDVTLEGDSEGGSECDGDGDSDGDSKGDSKDDSKDEAAPSVRETNRRGGHAGEQGPGRDDGDNEDEDDEDDDDNSNSGDDDSLSSEFLCASSDDDVSDASADSLDDFFSRSPRRRRRGRDVSAATTSTGTASRSRPRPDAMAKAAPTKHGATLHRSRTPSARAHSPSPAVYTDEGSSVFFSAEESLPDRLVGPLAHLAVHDDASTTPVAQRKTPSVSASRPAARSGRSSSSATPPAEPAATAKPQLQPQKLAQPQGTGRLMSPVKKLPRIPQTPHRPSTDAFWDQLVTDDWNMTHSPRKLLFDPDGAKTQNKDSTQARGSKGTKGSRGTKSTKAQKPADDDDTAASPLKKAPATAAVRGREAKRQFQQDKHDMATAFLAELDRTITQGELARLAAATGGVRIEWTNKLNTTAGRANWRRETLRPKKAVSSRGEDEAGGATLTPTTTTTTMMTTTQVLHHASIELAEKVIDDEHRLLNVVAHEFCHLANFMVSGVTGNPHGREFKAWAAQCSRHFASRGICVTTKHAYEIDFKYVWTCAACATEFKRHSKSIDPARHRCGACKGMLQQTKPVPRRGAVNAGAGNGGASRQSSLPPSAAPVVSEYQRFMKEHMAAVRRENPASPQKDIMRLVADKWTKAKADKAKAAAASSGGAGDNAAAEVGPCVDQLDKAFVDLTLS